MIRIGRAGIRFVKKARVATTPTVRVNTPTGQMRVSSPEATAIDLVRYPEHAGFLSNVATILRELVERIDGRELLRVATADAETAYDEIYRRFERLEQDGHRITQALRRIEAGLAGERGQREILERDLAELKQHVAALQSRIEEIEQRLGR